MGRPSTLADSSGNTWVSSTGYDYAGRPVSLDTPAGNETRVYNTLGQLTQFYWNNANLPSMQYVYSATQNNGQITQAITVGSPTNETVSYAYDGLKRLISASGSGANTWSQEYVYDGFGNLTSRTTNGTTQTIGVNAASNQLSSGSYDLNGNMTSGAGAAITYNEDNRMSSAVESGGGVEYYFYAPDGKRVFRQMASGSTEFTLWGAYGEQLGTYIGPGNPQLISVYFGKRLLWQGTLAYNNSAPSTSSFVMPDRLGSNLNAGVGTFYPYGDPSAPGQDKVEFATYTRDSYTGFDNAVNRYYSSYGGRFNTVDSGRARPKDPVSWNRYSYVGGDPVNRFDPRGLDWIYLGDGQWCSTLDPSGGCYDPEGDYGDDSLLAGSNNPCDAQSALFNPSAAVMGCMQYYTALPDEWAPPELCPLVSIVGNFTDDPKSPTPIHDIFAPTVAYALDAVIAMLNAEGIDPILEDGFRTVSEQAARQKSYPGVAARLSYHEIGDAIDFKRNQPGMAAIIAAMTAAGFTNGANFSTPDPGHFQLPTGILTTGTAAECTREHPNGQ